MKYRCVKCGHEVERLYIQYSPGNIRLVKCSNCMSIADEYIECELMILVIDLILHKPKAYRHLLFNLLDHKMLKIDTLLLKSYLIFFLLDAYKLWILNGYSHEWSILSLGVEIFGHALVGNLVFLYSFLVLSRKLLDFEEGFSSYKEVLLAIIASCYLKFYMIAMFVWDFPSSAVYITDLFVMSSNLVALRVITKSSFRRCVGVCIGAHVLKFFVHWALQDLTSSIALGAVLLSTSEALSFSYSWVAPMESQRIQTEVKQPSTAPPSATITSCRRKKKEDATFLEDVKSHIDEFIYASVDEHKSCFTKTIQKMFRMSKVVAQRTSDQQEIESILPLQTTTSKSSA